jgi:hypothetical protein
MQFEELRYVCQEAAVDLVTKKGRPLVPHVVLPGADRTRVLALADFPTGDEEAAHDYLAALAADEVQAGQVPCWGFVAEAEVGGEDAVVVVFGARKHAPHLTASGFDADGALAEFVPSEELDPTAMPFLHPLQHAVDQLPPLDQPPAGEGGGLPILG